jgi:hypothetical protein
MHNQIKILILTFLLTMFTNCSSTTTLPISSVTPASDITVNKTKDNNNNFLLEISVANLSSPQRLSPPKSVYVVWIVTQDNNSKNIGQLKVENAKKASLKTLTAFDPKEIFITAEDRGNTQTPQGPEISRSTLNN